MDITYKKALFFSGLASLSILVSAFSLEIFENLEPCQLCILQRWPHLILVILAFSGLFIIQKNWILLLICFSATITGIIGFYHVGVEQKWWSGPGGCSLRSETEMDISSLTNLLLNTPVVKCDEIVWSLLGISMAGWNSLTSFCIAFFAFFCWYRIMKNNRLNF